MFGLALLEESRDTRIGGQNLDALSYLLIIAESIYFDPVVEIVPWSTSLLSRDETSRCHFKR
jgi:hypothetical protein